MTTERFEMRVDTDFLEDVDKWRARQDDVPSRSEAVRRLVDVALQRNHQEVLSDGQKLILLALRDIQIAVGKGKNNDPLDLEFVADAILNDELWSLALMMPGVISESRPLPRKVRRVFDILTMFRVIDHSIAALNDKQRSSLDLHALTFRGFDGNNESDYLGITHFLITKMGRYSWLDAEKLNAHAPTVEWYERMLAVYEPISKRLMARDLSFEELQELAKEAIHPMNRGNDGEDAEA